MNSLSVVPGTEGCEYRMTVARPTSEICEKSLTGSYMGAFRSATAAVMALFEPKKIV